MSIIKPIPLETLNQEKFEYRLNLARNLLVPDELFFQITAHAPGYAEALFDAMYQSHALGEVDHTLKEIIRVRLTQFSKDTYFSKLRSKKAKDLGLTEEKIKAGCGNFSNDNQFTPAEKWALNYASLMYSDPKMVNANFYDQGKKLYSEANIIELGAFIAFHYGMQMFMRTLKMLPLDNSTQ